MARRFVVQGIIPPDNRKTAVSRRMKEIPADKTKITEELSYSGHILTHAFHFLVLSPSLPGSDNVVYHYQYLPDPDQTLSYRTRGELPMLESRISAICGGHMPRKEINPLVTQIMVEFADLTGLGVDRVAPRRYLWTDAFAVCNFIELFRKTGDGIWLEQAVRLVEQVHYILGRHRADDPRSGWISGLSEEEGQLHPTKGGVRIGKGLNERQPDEPFDERLEWDRDGQYYHYLTKWMHALHRVSCVTGDVTYTGWAVELARAVHARFSYVPAWGGPKRLYWKMSIDLSRPLVPSMGQHDPLDGLVTYCELQSSPGFNNELQGEIADMAAICRGMELATDDPLGIGGLLCDASRITRLIIRGTWTDTALLEAVVEAALLGLEAFTAADPLRESARYRLAFRELGLSIGLKGIEHVLQCIAQHPELFGQKNVLAERAAALIGYLPLAERIEMFWLDGKNRADATWSEHREINMVMLATCLAPEEFLTAV